MANEQNLKPNSERTPKERRKLAQKAGRASGESRRRRKSLGEAAQAVAKISLNDIGKNNLKRKGLNLDGIDPEDMNGIMALAMGQLVAGINGNSQAAQNFAEWLDLATKHKKDQLEIEKLQAEIDRLKMGSGGGSQDNEFLNAWKQSIIEGYKDSSDKDGEE